MMNSVRFIPKQSREQLSSPVPLIRMTQTVPIPQFIIEMVTNVMIYHHSLDEPRIGGGGCCQTELPG